MQKLNVGVILVAIVVVGCNTPTNTLQSAVEDHFGKTNNSSYTGPKPTTIIYSEQRGDWAFLIVGDDAEPRRALGQAWFVVVQTPNGAKWTVHIAGTFLIQGSSLIPVEVVVGGDLAKKKAKEAPLNKNIEQEWMQKWSEYLKSKGYTIPPPT